VNASRAKKVEKSHDPLALVAHTSSSSRTTTPYYVTHPALVVDYDDDYQGDVVQNNSDDSLTSAMILLARAITQHFSNPTNNRLCTSSNTRNQAIVQGDRVNIQSKNSRNDGRNLRRSYVQEETIEGNNVQNDVGNIQRTLRTTSSGTAANDEAGVILIDEQNNFLFADASRMEEIEELSANICLMARIQPTNFDSNEGPSYDFAFLNLEQQRDRLDLSVVEFKRQIVELQKSQSNLKQKMSKNEDKYHDTIIDLEARAKKNEDVVLKMGLRAISSVRRPSHGDSSFKNSVLSNTKNLSAKVEVSDRTNKKLDVASQNVDSNKNIMGEPLLPDRVFDFPVYEPEPHPAYDFFMPRPLPGYAGNPNNNNGWIEADVPLLGELGVIADEPMVGPIVDEITKPIVEAEE
ncbi:hypothetical protein Tco_0543476, partial [Tanacetum coccineum]